MCIRDRYAAWKPSNKARLTLAYIHEFDRKKGKFQIELKCAKTNKVMGFYNIEKSSDGELEYFDIPLVDSICEIAIIRVKARPGEFSSAIHMTLNELDLDLHPMEFSGAEK